MKRILSIDGGGIKGVFPASFLATLEEEVGGTIADYFDLIVGTSTGGIIALALGLGWSAKEILEFYEEDVKTVFRGNRLVRTARRIGFSKYSNEPLREVLSRKFGDHTLGDSSTRLVVPALNLETGEIYVYKTAHHPRLMRDYKVKIVDVALATSAAPTYFPTHRTAAGTPLIDGGMWANNPVGFAVVEAIGVLNWDRNSLRVLSLGCTSEALNIGVGRKLPLGLGYWGTKVVSVFMSAQSSSSLGTAQLLAGHKNIERINPSISPGRFGLDLIREISSLRGLGDSEARKALPRLRLMFLAAKADVFTPEYPAASRTRTDPS